MSANALDVLIVGAGPAGMVLATALQRHGVRFRIIDKDEGPTNATRAPVLWQRTQEILAALGIRDLWLPESHSIRGESLHLYGKVAGELPLRAPTSPYPEGLLTPQSVTERLLDGYLARSESAVEYGREALDYWDKGDHALVRMRKPDGGEETVAARWVVSAEGSRSIVRHDAGLDYESEKYVGFRIHTADVVARWTYPTPVGQLFFLVEAGCYLGGQRLPGDPNRFYFYILTPDETPEYDGHEIALGDVQSLVRRISGDDGATLSDPVYLNTARYQHGLADTYRSGRALLIGDAARNAPPLYGQGMNYAMHDAWNLAWKLAHVVKGWAPEALIDTFASERHKLGQDLDARINSTFRFITEPKPFQASLVRTLGPKLLGIDIVKHAAEPVFTEMEITYAGVGLSEGGRRLGRVAAGDRAGALWVKRLPDCNLANLLDLYDGLRWTLLAMVSTEADEAQKHELVGYIEARQADYPQSLRAVVLSCGPGRPAPLALETLVDAESRFIREHDLPSSCLILVRPDGHVARISRNGDAELDAYLSRWLRPQADGPEQQP